MHITNFNKIVGKFRAIHVAKEIDHQNNYAVLYDFY